VIGVRVQILYHMGIDFRGRGYVRRVRFGKRTVKDGEAVAIWDNNGRHKQIIGPALVRMYYSTIRFLDRHVASTNEYLKIRNVDGTVEHRRGPAALFENPVYHLGVTVEKAILLEDASHHLIVRRSGGSTGSSSSASVSSKPETISGPALFFPEITDTVRTFNWTDKGGGALLENGKAISTDAKVVRNLKVEMTGADGHSASAKFTFCIKLAGVEQVLAVTDPILECGAVVGRRIREATSSIRFLNQGSTIDQAVRGACSSQAFTKLLSEELLKHAGCVLISSGVTSVEPSDELQKLLRKEDELAAAKLNEEVANAKLEAQIARQEREHALEVTRQQHSLKLEEERERVARERKEREAKKAIEFLKELRSTGADVNRYLEAQGAAVCALNGAPTPREPEASSGLLCGAAGAKKSGGGWW